MASFDEVVEKKVHLWSFSGMYTGSATMENSMESLKKIKIELLYDPTVPLLSDLAWLLEMKTGY